MVGLADAQSVFGDELRTPNFQLRTLKWVDFYPSVRGENLPLVLVRGGCRLEGSFLGQGSL